MANLDKEKLKFLGQEMAIKFNLKLLVLFGSQATGRTHKNSDIDIGFLSDRDYGPGEVANMQVGIEQELGTGPVELVDLKSAPSLLQRHVATEGLLLVEREPGIFAQFKITAIKKSMEARKLISLQHLSLVKFLAAR